MNHTPDAFDHLIPPITSPVDDAPTYDLIDELRRRLEALHRESYDDPETQRDLEDHVAALAVLRLALARID